jgi:hypothetical protein
MVIHAGDFTTLSLYEQLSSRNRVEAVCGNMDELALCTLLPTQRRVEVLGKCIYIVHGEGKSKKELASLFPDADCLIFGHTHSPYNRKIGKVLLFNPGSCTDIVFVPFKSFGLLYINGDEISGEIIKI